MDFGALPPEINSTRMYSGPGSAPMLAAAAAWERLVDDLYSTASAYGSAIADVTGGPWHGPGSTAMAAAATPHLQWITATAARAAQAATQAKVAAAVYEAAFAQMIPPVVITANRVELASLIATNILGQNTPAIAATEADYSEMWAQDAAAMYGYAGSSAAATKLNPFTPPPPINPTHLAAPAATIGQLDNTSAASNPQTLLSTASQLHSAMTNVLHTFASPTPWSASPPSVPSSPVPLTSPEMPDMNPSAAAMSTLKPIIASISAGSVASKHGLALGRAVSVRDWFVGGTRNSWAHHLTRTTGKPEASLASADTVGALSVPQTWKATRRKPHLRGSVAVD